MKRAIYLVSIILPVFLVLASCNSIKNLKTAVEYDKQANFASYNSYKFDKELSYSDTHDNYSSENQRTFENAIHDQLRRKGLEETETPNLYVNFFVVDTQESKSITHTSYRSQRYGGMSHVDTYIKNYELGTLVIDLIDVSSKKLVWRGLANGVITGKQKDMQRTINEAVRAILSKYPPRK
ncbi:DUF4136 domain-containing protein [Allomuricauda sp. d1]|uniref:DUF4136 domain-containing protein n=1 Tax=Allomuricauda sp. d1 TaxID=3136725 RepID=UPI0031D9EF16